jgi:hypothetical protein
MSDLIRHKRSGEYRKYPTQDFTKNTSSILELGEIAVNYFVGDEFLTISNKDGGVVEFRPMHFIEQRLPYVLNVDMLLATRGELFLTNEEFVALMEAYSNGRLVLFQYNSKTNLVVSATENDDKGYTFLTMKQMSDVNIDYITFTIQKIDDGYNVSIGSNSLTIPSTDNFIEEDDALTEQEIKDICNQIFI